MDSDPYLLNGFNLLMVKHHTGSQWIQSAHGKTSYEFDVLLSSTSGATTATHILANTWLVTATIYSMTT